MASHSKVAGGDIRPKRFVKIDISADGKVKECDAGEKVYGISQRGTRNTPYSSLDDGFAAISGENVGVYGVGEKCPLTLGGTVVRGDRLKSDADGKGVATVTNLDEYGAIAMMSGVSGDEIEVMVQLGQISA